MARTNKEPVRIRFKDIKGGGKSIYLDIYFKGKRRYEFLRLYLSGDNTRESRERNRETMRTAEAIRAKRTVEIISGQYGIGGGKEGTLVSELFSAMCAERTGNASTATSWRNAMQAFFSYADKDKLTFADIDNDFASGYRRHLEQLPAQRKGGPIAINTRRVYWEKFRALLHRAQAEGYLRAMPAARGFSKPESSREYLSAAELRHLADTPCPREDVRRAFLFSALTGLRWSDTTSLTWGEVQDTPDGARIVFRQKKTGGMEWLDINRQARTLLGERGEAAAQAVPVCSKQAANDIVAKWTAAAGITKHITFHCARHTFAVLMLDTGADIYTVSKLLGHRELRTTQVYAKILDKNKRAAVERMPDILGHGQQDE